MFPAGDKNRPYSGIFTSRGPGDISPESKMGPAFLEHHGVEIVKIGPPQTHTFGYLTSQVIAEMFFSPEVSYLKKNDEKLKFRVSATPFLPELPRTCDENYTDTHGCRHAKPQPQGADSGIKPLKNLDLQGPCLCHGNSIHGGPPARGIFTYRGCSPSYLFVRAFRGSC